MTKSEAFKPELAKRLAERKAANSPWLDKTRETGKRSLMRVCLPRYNTKGDTWPIFVDLEEQLTQWAGGFTMYSATGGWRNSKGKRELELNYIYEVSYVPDTSLQRTLENLFCDTARLLGVTWLHCELHHFTANHMLIEEDK